MKEVRRNSSIELLRIVAMMLVIAHHYVVNSGVDVCYNSVIGMTYARSLGLNAHGPYLMVSESDRFVSVVVGALLFLVFKNLSLPYNRFVNAIASTTFGVLLIHSAGDGMRRFLWDDFLAVRMHAESLPLFELIGYSLACMFGVFAACGAIDWLRIVLVERPVLRWIGGCVKR